MIDRPEDQYARKRSSASRQAVVEKYSPHVANFCRQYCPGHQQEGFQAGIVGLLVALEKFDPSRGYFWPFAKLVVRSEIQKWMEFGVNWQRRERRGGTRCFRKSGARPELHRTTDFDLDTLHSESSPLEYETREALEKLREFTSQYQGKNFLQDAKTYLTKEIKNP